MKNLVVYQSSTGFTAKYAEWIAKELSCEAKELKKVKPQELSEYDCIIFGGWIMGGMISGLDKINKMNPPKLIVFAVGASGDNEKLREELKSQNHLEQIPFFYMQGGINFEKLSFFPKMMLKMMGKSIAKKENRTEKEKEMLELFAASSDNSDIANIKPLVEYVNKFAM